MKSTYHSAGDHVVAHHEHRNYVLDLIICTVATWTKRRTTTESSRRGSRRSFTALRSRSSILDEASWVELVHVEAPQRGVTVHHATWRLYHAVLLQKSLAFKQGILHDVANRSTHGTAAEDFLKNCRQKREVEFRLVMSMCLVVHELSEVWVIAAPTSPRISSRRPGWA